MVGVKARLLKISREKFGLMNFDWQIWTTRWVYGSGVEY
jgi:hypothetical protein